MDEVDGLRKRYNEAASWALIEEPKISRDIQWAVGRTDVRAVYGSKKDMEVVVSFEPLKVVLLRKGKEQVVFNGGGLLHLEHFRTKGAREETRPEDVPEEGLDVEDAQKIMTVKPSAWFEGDSEDDWWEETFSSWTDSKPKGINLISYSRPPLTIHRRPRVSLLGRFLSQPWTCLRYPTARDAT
jgi:alpha 1,3-glucosidase